MQDYSLTTKIVYGACQDIFDLEDIQICLRYTVQCILVEDDILGTMIMN